MASVAPTPQTVYEWDSAKAQEVLKTAMKSMRCFPLEPQDTVPAALVSEYLAICQGTMSDPQKQACLDYEISAIFEVQRVALRQAKSEADKTKIITEDMHKLLPDLILAYCRGLATGHHIDHFPFPVPAPCKMEMVRDTFGSRIVARLHQTQLPTATTVPTQPGQATLDGHGKLLEDIAMSANVPGFVEAQNLGYKHDNYMRDSRADVELNLAKAIKAGHLTVTVRMIAEALLLPEKLQTAYCAMLLYAPQNELLKAHNYFIARQYEERSKNPRTKFILSQAKAILDLDSPLHHVYNSAIQDEADAKNTEMFRRMEVAGAGPETSQGNPFSATPFTAATTRQETRQKNPRGSEPVTGGAFQIPVDTRPDGRMVVDVTVIEDTVKSMQQTQAQMSSTLNQLVRQMGRADSQQRQQGYRRGNGGNGFSGSRGRGGGRGGGPRGADSPLAELDVKQTPPYSDHPHESRAFVGALSSDDRVQQPRRVASGTPACVTPCSRERSTIVAITEPSEDVEGGNFYDCLSNKNIDTLLPLLLAERAIAARAFYDVRIGVMPPSSLARLLRQRVSTHQWVLLPIHTRFHWASAIIRADTKTTTLTATILDSAPSPATLKDFIRVFATMDITSVTTARYHRQKRYTNDCGLHVILVALILSESHDGTPPAFRMRKLALTKWRPILDENAKNGTTPDKRDLLKIYPVLSEAFEANSVQVTEDGILGGAPAATRIVPTTSSPKTVRVSPIPHQLAPPTPAGERDEIDVDALEQTERAHGDAPIASPSDTSFSLEDLKREGLPHRRSVVNWFRGMAASQKDGRYTADTVNAKLCHAPEEVKKDKELWDAIQSAVKRICDRQNFNAREMSRELTFDGKKRGMEISDRIVDWVIDAAPTLPEWSIIKPARFGLYASSGSKCIAKSTLRNSVAAIVYLPGHYILLSWHEGRLQLRDSLNDPTPKIPAPATLKLVGRFLHLIGQNAATNLELVPCPRQDLNNCAVESLNNLIEITTGKRGSMSRDMIAQVERSSDPYNAKHIWARAWRSATLTRPEVKATDTPRKAAPEGTEQLLEPVSASPQHTQANHSDKCQSCNRPALADQFCGWHHPKISCNKNRPNCDAPTKKGTCYELSLAVAGVHHCQYHLSTHERNRVTAALNPPAPSQPIASPDLKRETIGDGSKGIPHAEVLRFVQRVGARATIEMTFQPYSAQLMTVKAVVSQLPKGNPLPVPGIIKITARLCALCGEWHRREDSEIPVPTKGVTYFKLSSGTSQDCDFTDECDFGETGSDASDGDLRIDDDDVDPQASTDVMAMIGRECQTIHPTVSVSHTLANITKHWCIIKTGIKPPNIPGVVWRALSQGSRDVHIRWLQRLRHFPPELATTSLPCAAVETVMRLAVERRWAWSTIASGLSAMASALNNLCCYTNQREGIDLRSDAYYRAALQYSQKMARVHAVNPKNCTPLSIEVFHAKSKCLAGFTGAWILWQLSWYLAARVGDVRRLDPKNISIDDDVDEHNTVAIRALFTQGKGAHFWGPYTIHARVPVPIAKVVLEYCRSNANNATLCNTPDQRRIADLLREIPGHSIRSIRRGSLVHYAGCGASDSNLLKLSGHRNLDTLLRYLGWGRVSSEAAAAAIERTNLEHSAAINRQGTETGEARNFAGQPVLGAGAVQSKAKPMWMGQYSGFNGKKGKRIENPPDLFPKNAPSAKDLGIQDKTSTAADRAHWPLHVKKDLPCMKLDELELIVRSPELRGILSLLREWIEQPSHYGVDFPPLAPAQIPYAKFTDQQMIAMLEGMDPKVQPMSIAEPSHFEAGSTFASIDNVHIKPMPADISIRCAANAFAIAQELKEKYRPIFETLYNQLIDKEALPLLTYPSRLERRTGIARAKYRIQFDFSAWYDQIKLGEKVLPYHVIRTRTPIVCNGVPYTLFALTREPMGSAHSAHVAQYITWCILEPILKMEGVDVHTMIDNVTIFGDDVEAFVRAVTLFLERCKQVGATLNDADKLPRNRAEIIAQGTVSPFTFLGEVYLADGTVKNTDHNVTKLRLAYERLQASITNESIVVTKRQVAAIIGLWTWLTHTINRSVNCSFEMLRLHSSVAASPHQWDDRIKLSVTDISTIGTAITAVLKNQPATPIPIALPSVNHSDYAATIIVDASRTGFGALVLTQGHVLEVKGGFYKEKPHSAHAEPLAASLMLDWARSKVKGPFAIVTDHIALAQGQRRPVSGKGGFSKSYFLNAFFQNLYSDNLNHQVFYIPGDENPADAASRSNKVGDPISVTIRPDTIFPSLANLFHPFATAETRPWWIA